MDHVISCKEVRRKIDVKFKETMDTYNRMKRRE